MAKRQKGVCPGCSRHCSAGNVRCKYGQRHFEKIQKTQSAEAACDQKIDIKNQRYKWEKYVQPGGLAWKLLWIGSRSKRALLKKDLTEQELLGALNEAEQAQLNALLGKISDEMRLSAGKKEMKMEASFIP